MKVMLVNPTGSREMGFWPSLGLAYVGVCLEQAGHDVRLLDRELAFRQKGTLELVDEESARALETFAPDIVGIGATTPTIPDAFRGAELAKCRCPGVPVVLGGTHATILPEETLAASPAIDVVVRGEGEQTMQEICAGADLATVAGVVFRMDGQIIRTPARSPLAHLDAIPFPARHLYEMKEYLRSGSAVIRGVELRATHLFTSRGCPYRCSFCAGSAVFGDRVRFVSAGRVIEEIETILADYKVEGLYFAEDMFAANRRRALEICRLLVDSGLSRRIVWCAQLRVNSVDEELLTAMRRAGCIQVEYGFESGSQRILDLMNKKSTVKQNYDAAVLTRRAGIRVLADIIVGTPGETREDFMETIGLLKAVRPDHVGFNRYVPLPGSAMFSELRQRGLVEEDWTKYHVGLGNNQDVNFTAMPDRVFADLFEEFRNGWVKPCLDRAYVRYNLPRKPVRTLRSIAGRLVADPSLLRRALRAVIRRA